MEHTPNGWLVNTEDETFGPFDVLVFNLPSEQLAKLCPREHKLPPLPSYTPTHAVMMRFDQPLPLEWDTATPDHPALGWICREASKPGRPDLEQWILHSKPGWSAQHLEDPLTDIETHLITAFQEHTGVSVNPTKTQTHRWRYAQVEPAANQGSAWDTETQLGICGDIFGSGVEGALLSGAHLAGRIMGTLYSQRRWQGEVAPLFSTLNKTSQNDDAKSEASNPRGKEP